MKIADPKGKWYINRGFYSFHDPESSTVFEPGVLTKAAETTWLKGQPVIEEVADPLGSAPVKEAKPKEVKKAE